MSEPRDPADRYYIEVTATPEYKARDLAEISLAADGTELDRQVVVSFTRGTPPEAVPDALTAIRRAYEAGRRDERRAKASNAPSIVKYPEIYRESLLSPAELLGHALNSLRGLDVLRLVWRDSSPSPAIEEMALQHLLTIRAAFLILIGQGWIRPPQA
jgi:hypothetical protein